VRRRVRAQANGQPPLPLSRYKGSTTREALSWLSARMKWWDENHGPEDAGDLQWLFDGFAQTGESFPFCGSIGASCGDDDCLCTLDQEAET
jgi:hypothetical protein